MKKDVFAKNGLFELGNTQKLEQYLRLWLGEDMRMDAKSKPKYVVQGAVTKNNVLYAQRAYNTGMYLFVVEFYSVHVYMLRTDLKPGLF